MKISWFTVLRKRIFGGWEAVVDYVLCVLNEAVSAAGLTARLSEIASLAEKVLGYMEKYQSLCPAKWRDEYDAALDAANAMAAAFKDGKLTADEAKTVAEAFRKAYAAWMEED